MNNEQREPDNAMGNPNYKGSNPKMPWRLQIAVTAMRGLVSRENVDADFDVIARASFAIADAMLREYKATSVAARAATGVGREEGSGARPAPKLWCTAHGVQYDVRQGCPVCKGSSIVVRSGQSKRVDAREENPAQNVEECIRCGRLYELRLWTGCPRCGGQRKAQGVDELGAGQ